MNLAPSLNAVTIDVEEHFQVQNFEHCVRRADWESHPSRVVANTRCILRLLADHGVHGTFFVLGWVADHQPALVEEIAAQGHEVATHGYFHELIYRQTPQEFAQDVRRSLDSIEAACGIRPVGFRAACFSITERSLWAVDVLKDLGLQYSSSVFPLVAHDRYGLRGASRFASRWPNGLWEFPVSTLRVAGQNWPVAGGGYLRLYPQWVTRQAIRRLNAEGHPAVVYVHPWEVDPGQPRMPGLPALARFRHYVNLDKTESRLDGLLSEFAFGPMREAFALELATGREQSRDRAEKAVSPEDALSHPEAVASRAARLSPKVGLPSRGQV
jgi:polysaccharide deacetylase family protein (PEP-CTERM system associated)